MTRIQVCAVGRLKAGPEHRLIDDYTTRFDRAGRALGLGPLAVREVDDRRGGGMAAQADLLRRALPAGAVVCALDERGRAVTSPVFAQQLAAWRDQGAQDVCFLIGGADGLDPSLVEAADMSLSFGKMVWPHMLARVMLVEQLFRAASILAGHPYHRV